MKFKKLTIVFAVGLGIISAGAPCIMAAPSGEVIVVQLNDDTINPVTAEYLIKAIDRAEAEDARCLVIKLDTPGGLLNSTRSIVKRMMSSQVPVVVYIAPSGSRAGSAGVFITYASHIAAMAPSTNIGAAHPIQMGGQRTKQKDVWEGLKELIETARRPTPQEQKKDDIKGNAEDRSGSEPEGDILENKILQDTVAFIKALAIKRNRNVDWAVRSVTQSDSITETEAQQLGVVEIIAQSDRDLLSQIDGRTVPVGDKIVTLATKDAFIVEVAMDFRQRLFNVLANPNVAYILLILGFYGLLYEITHPGIGVPGVLGTIFLILAFFSMQTLPTNYAGLALVILGLLLFIAEAFVPGLGLLTLGGAVCMILGSLLLFDSGVPMMRVSLPLILAFTLTTAGITIFLVRAVLQAHRRKAVSGQEGLIGEKGVARTPIPAGKEGKVFVHGELWNAVSDTFIEKGDKIVVVAVEHMQVTVRKI